MKRPYKYTVISNTTKQVVYETNSQPWSEKYHTTYVDTRYEARLRLYKYLTKKTR